MAGSRKGIPNKRTQARRQMTVTAIAQGVMPLEVILNNMRHYFDEAGKLLETIKQNLQNPSDETVRLFAKMMNMRDKAEMCAADAAPYCHPKLANITMSGEVTHKLPDRMTDERALEVLRDRGTPLPPIIIEHEPAAGSDQVH